MKKYFAREQNFYLLRLKTKDDYLTSLIDFARKNRINSAFILNSIGMLKNVELAYFQGKGKYKRHKFVGPMEVTSIQGNIGKTEKGEYKLHIHATLADKSGVAYAGHLEKGKVWVTAEILLLKLNKIKLKRGLEKKTDLFGLYFK